MEKIAVAVSGGVDSAVALCLLKKQGYEVTAFFTDHFECTLTQMDGTCCGMEKARIAAQTARYLEVPFYRLNLIDVFKKEVIAPFLDYYQRGLTPNPCVVCNTRVRFGVFMDKLQSMGYDALATGHYAVIKEGRLCMGRDQDKDQSYFLYGIPAKRLDNIIFPLGEITKKEVRKIAAAEGLPAQSSPESQDSCILMNSSLPDFISESLKPVPGDIVDMNGKAVGRHSGYQNYTIGQRKGLGALGSRMYVIGIEPSRNRVVAGIKEELLSGSVSVKLSEPGTFSASVLDRVRVKIRYGHAPADCTIKLLDADSGLCTADFDQPQFSVTPGQSAVFYAGRTVIGGGEILPSG